MDKVNVLTENVSEKERGGGGGGWKNERVHVVSRARIIITFVFLPPLSLIHTDAAAACYRSS